jgi:carbon-monoxide dehydrogenase large subunit
MSDDGQVPAGRFIGQRVARKEDRRLLTGRGSYTDDVVLPGMQYAAFVRSPVAKGQIRSVDTAAAREVPGVRAVLTAADFEHLPTHFFLQYGAPGAPTPDMRPLAQDRVCFAGDPVVIVVAVNRYVAEDAAALVDVQYEIETPVVTLADARTGAVVHPALGANLGNESASPPDPAIDRIFAGAAHVVTGGLRHQRQTHAPMEGRGIIASLQGAGELLIYVSCQSPHMAARFLSKTFDIPDQNVRVIAKDVGGAFGQKVQLGREEIAVVAAALVLKVPVKWTEDRLENLTSATQAREQAITVRMAFDADARLLATDVDYEQNLGAFPLSIDSNAMAMNLIPGPYRVGSHRFHATGWFSNTGGQGPYRGPWMMESLARETMLDVAARQIGIDPIELRRRNLLRAEDQPYTMLSGTVVDRVTPLETLELAVAKIDVPAFRAEQAAARKQGRYLGLGVAVYIEPTTMAHGGALASEMAHVRVDPTGKVVAVLSTHSQGNSTETTMAQVLADTLGVDISDVSVMEDDSSRGGFGAGAGGSRQAVAGGGAAIQAATMVKDKIKAIAGHLMNANPDDVEMVGGLISVRGVAETTSTLREVAEVAYLNPARLPPDMELGLEFQYRYRPPPLVFSNAAHACIVEVDVETGLVKILRWVASEDCGVMINPNVVEGQIAGGVAQGIGGVLMEHTTYDAAGNPTAVTLKDYLLPTLHDVPLIEYCHLITPSHSTGGFKGVGEGGAIISPPTLVNAIADALSPFGVRCEDLPLSPDRILKMLEAAPLQP